MIAEILATGDEVRCGALIDSNSAHIATELEAAGVEVGRHTCVGDDIAAIAALLVEISTRADLGLVSGGLGPTVDDVTREAAALAAGLPLVSNAGALAEIEAFFAGRGRSMPAANRKQALMPSGAERLPNPIGTAPGFTMGLGRCRFFFLPGVPAEMRRMLAEQVLPRVAALGGKTEARAVHILSTFGLSEALVDAKLAAFASHFPAVRLGLRAKFPEIQVRLYGAAAGSAELERKLAEAGEWVRERLGAVVFSTRGWAMEAEVGDLLARRGLSLALAESCTGGLLAHRLTEVPGSSRYFSLAVVAYANASKVGVLGVRPETLAQWGAVDEHTVVEMAEGARRLAGSDYGLATSGIAGPQGGTEEKPVGTVCVGLAGPEGAEGRRFRFAFGSRAMHKRIFAMTALELLRRRIQGVPERFEVQK